MSWYSSIFKRDPAKEYIKQKPQPIGQNIYGSTDTRQHQKRFHVIHYVFKYKFFVPLLMLGRRILKKHLVKEIPPDNWNRNILIFDKAFEEAEKKWHIYYLRNSGDPDKRLTREAMLERCKNEKYLRTMKEFVNTMYMHDTAYREFMNILMHEIAREMVDYYAVGDHKSGHLFFTTDIYDTHYFVLEKAIQYQVMIGVSDSEGMLRAQEELIRVQEEMKQNEREQRSRERNDRGDEWNGFNYNGAGDDIDGIEYEDNVVEQENKGLHSESGRDHLYVGSGIRKIQETRNSTQTIPKRIIRRKHKEPERVRRAIKGSQQETKE